MEITLLDPSAKSLLISKNKSHGKACVENTGEGESSAQVKQSA